MNEREFEHASRRLEGLVREDYCPDLVVGIAMGGEFLAAMMFKDIPHVSVRMHRPSTADKERASIVFRILRRSPRKLSDALRLVEARVLRMKSLWEKPRKLQLKAEATEAIATAKRVLVVDDAVDSGATMKAVIDAVSSVKGEREVRSAVITMTTSSPKVKPSYALFRNGTLIRFPWSKDFYRL
ncbi:MAG: hypothetical protein K2M06_07965 [Muribaculaceae bacterium]|nr:hypothetical protein [Muribaculaceae bacterium]